MTTLEQLAVGQRGAVSAISGSDELAQRLLEMGLTPGVEVTYLGASVWGDPLEFEVRGYRLSLRKSEAARIEIVGP